VERSLLCGPAGSGKTERVVAEIRQLLDAGATERFVVLVPTYSRAEHLKRRVLRGGLPGIFDRGIGTFEQAAERRTGRRLSELAPAPVRDALLADALAECAPTEFARASRFAGFRRAALRLLKELKSTDQPDGVDEAIARAASAAEALPASRGTKLVALAPVLRSYQRRLAAAGLLDHEDLLREFLARLRTDPGPPLRLFALDGFTDLTEVQTRIVQILAGNAERALVTLLADAERPGGPFGAGASLREALLRGSGMTEVRLSGNHRACGDLARLERGVADGAVSATVTTPDGSVRFLAGSDRDDEADRVARTCLRFVADHAIARSDVLVIVRSLESETATRVLDALRRHGVPARRIGPSPLVASPTVRNVLRVLRLLAGLDEKDDALAALRSGAARGVEVREADRLDREAALRGVHGLDGLSRLAQELPSCRSWIALLRRLAPSAAPQAPSAVAARLLEAVEELTAFSFDAAGAGDDARLASDAAALSALVALVGESVQAVAAGNHPALTPAEFVARVEEQAASASFTAPDRRADVVNVVDAGEARQWEARAVVVAGLRLGEWPAGAREDLFVSDRDRDAVAKGGVRLPSRLDEAQRRERLLFYTAVTRARERLVLTTSLTDEKGDPEIASPFLEDALRIFGGAGLEGAERSPGDVRPAAGECFGEDDLARTALASLTERFEPGTSSERRARTGAAVLERLLADPSPRAAGRHVLVDAARWFRGRARPLSSRGAARLALAAPRRRSASSLATFAQCSYRYFADKGLGLSEPEAAAHEGPDAALLGSIAHAALEATLRGRLSGEGAERAFDAVWDEHASRFAMSLRLARERAALRRVVLDRIAREAERPLVPGFVPREFERAFGLDGAPPLVVAAVAGPRGEAVEVAGKIDRVDVDGAGRAIVLDYKYSDVTRYSKLEAKLDAGTDLQLPLYALAAERVLGREVVAAGYVTLRDGKERWLRLAADAPGRPRADVSWVGPDRAAKLAAVEARVRELDGRIREGAIAASPRDPERCGRGKCPFADLCRYEGTSP
jgi:ATP-dependent helicase/DNAse subunit B